HMRAFGDGPRHFEPWSSDVDDTRSWHPSPNYHTTPTGRRFISWTDLTCIAALHGGSRSGIKFRTHGMPAMIRYPLTTGLPQPPNFLKMWVDI
ncbi:hypothetical protein TNCV_2304671, partial [Trichonephila clavipes]